MDIWISIVVTFVLVLVNGYFSMSEMALVNARHVLLQHDADEGDKSAQRALGLAADSGQFLATIQVATAIITEATLSFLGVGAPPTSPSLGTLIRIGNDYLFSGEWWITVFPGVMLVLIALSVNLLGDWLRDALNPRLR